MEQILKIGVFYDGNYFLRVSGYYHYDHWIRQHINIGALHNFMEHRVAEVRNVEVRQCRICDAHLFRGRYTAHEAREKGLLYNERLFEDVLIENDVQWHYRFVSEGREKGIDALMTLETVELARLKQYDVVVLVTGDSDYVPLVRKLYGLGCETMLLCWDLTSTKKENGKIINLGTSALLWEAVDYPLAMHQVIEKGFAEENNLILGLFGITSIPNKIEETRETTATKPDPLRIKGKIRSVNGERGFIRFKNQQAIFYKNNVDLGVPFENLKAGDQVEFSLLPAETGGKKEAIRILVLHK